MEEEEEKEGKTDSIPSSSWQYLCDAFRYTWLLSHTEYFHPPSCPLKWSWWRSEVADYIVFARSLNTIESGRGWFLDMSNAKKVASMVSGSNFWCSNDMHWVCMHKSNRWKPGNIQCDSLQSCSVSFDWKEQKKQQDKKCCSLEIVYLRNGNLNMLFSNAVSTHLLRP